jgi:hypothetical protein
MRPVTYREEHRPKVVARVRARYAEDIRILSGLGFRELCFYNELLGPYSRVTQCLRLLFMRTKREVLVYASPLQAGAAFVLLQHSEPATIVIPMGFGVKLYSRLADGTLVLTTSFKSVAMPRPDARVLKAFGGESPADAWRTHRERIPPLGSPVLPAPDFAAFISMAQQEEASLSSVTASG